jgi:predicted DNA-binding transcriptional regulator AlpA
MEDEMTKTAELASEDRVVREPEVCAITSLRPTTIAEKVRDGTFPAPRRLGKRIKGWDLREILEWKNNLKRHGEPGFEIKTTIPAPKPKRRVKERA